MIAERIRGTKLVMLPHASHVFMTDQTEATVPAITTKTRKPRNYIDEFVRNRTRVETLLVDLGLTSTFVSVAEVSSGAKRQRNIVHARNAFCTIRDVLSRACTPSDAEYKEIDRKLRQLKHRLLRLSTSVSVLPFPWLSPDSPDIRAVRGEQLFNN
jgi:hypothetical protein